MCSDWMFHQCVCLLTTHMHINKYTPKIAHTWESCVPSCTMQIDAALNEQRIMLATSVERALKNSCFVSGMAVVRLCIH